MIAKHAFTFWPEFWSQSSWIWNSEISGGVCGKSAKGRKMAEENNGNNLCESSDSIMTILDQMADSVQLDYTGGHFVL